MIALIKLHFVTLYVRSAHLSFYGFLIIKFLGTFLVFLNYGKVTREDVVLLAVPCKYIHRAVHDPSPPYGTTPLYFQEGMFFKLRSFLSKVVIMHNG